MAGRFDLMYVVTSLSRFSADPREGNLELSNKVFGYTNKHPKQGYAINPQPLTTNMEYKKVDLNMDFDNQYSYFQEEIDDRLSEPLFDEFDLKCFVDADHGHDKVTGRSTKGLIYVLGSIPKNWSSKRQTSVQTSTFASGFTALKNAV